MGNTSAKTALPKKSSDFLAPRTRILPAQVTRESLVARFRADLFAIIHQHTTRVQNKRARSARLGEIQNRFKAQRLELGDFNFVMNFEKYQQSVRELRNVLVLYFRIVNRAKKAQQLRFGDRWVLKLSGSRAYRMYFNVEGPLSFVYSHAEFARLPGFHASRIYSGGMHAFFCTEDRAVFAIGDNQKGQLGLGHWTSAAHPVLQTRVPNIKNIRCGHEFSVFLTNFGDVFSCGDNSCGQLGIGNFEQKCKPKRVQLPCKISKVRAGNRHAFLISQFAAGPVFVVGDNSKCQLVQSHERLFLLPRKLEDIVLYVRCGHDFSLVVYVETRGGAMQVQTRITGDFMRCGTDFAVQYSEYDSAGILRVVDWGNNAFLCGSNGQKLLI